MSKIWQWILILFFSFFSCQPQSQNKYSMKDAKIIHDASTFLTQIIVYDIFKPPVAARIYAYTYLAAYEAIRLSTPNNPAFPDLAGKLNKFTGVTQPEKGKEYYFPLVSMRAFFTVGKKITFSPEIWEEFGRTYFDRFNKMDLSKEVIEESNKLGIQIGTDIINYAKGDHYSSTRGVGYVLKREPGSWEPTPPSYADACEPLWNTLRPFCLDSSAQFLPASPTSYSNNPKSKFYLMTDEVRKIVNNLSPEQKAIAYFWDDNAFVSQVKGHVMIAEKKMTPSGHWIAITKTLCKTYKKDLLSSIQAYCFASISMNDAFIGSWEEKYRTSRIRPITVIRRWFDPNWNSFLENPSFPEYDSGHSAISAAAGTMLIHLFGDQTAFTDSTEYLYGHGVRHFNSIGQAFNEVSMSRVYGGIHFRESVEQGTLQGKVIGEWDWKKLNR